MKNNLLKAVLIAAVIILAVAGFSCGNSPPVIDGIITGDTWVEVSTTQEMRAQVSDPEGDELEYIWSVDGGDITSMSPVAVWTAPEKPGLYTVTLTVRDSNNNETVEKLSVGVVDNFPPIISSLHAEPSAVGQGKTTTITCSAYDPEGGEVRYQWEPEAGELIGSGSVVTWMPPKEGETCDINVTVTDEKGASARMSIKMDIMPNHDPKIESVTSNPRVLRPGLKAVIECIASDIDGDELEYSWALSGERLASTGSTVEWVAPELCKRYEFQVTVNDGRGGEATETLPVSVVKEGG